MTSELWKVSLHGGHCGQYCDHARGTLREVIEAAIDKGYKRYGVTEHMARTQKEFLYPEEKEMGWTVETLEEMFRAYGEEINELAREFAPQITILKGFEAEVVPTSDYPGLVRDWMDEFDFDYFVGSVHHVGEILIDGPRSEFERALRKFGTMEQLALEYYKKVLEMVEELDPPVVGHLDLIIKNGRHYSFSKTEAVKKAVLVVLDEIARRESLLEINAAGYRKGLHRPYPAPWIVEEAKKRDISFTFGDDSHGPQEVGMDLEKARNYLLNLEVNTIATLDRQDGKVITREIPLS